MAGSRYERELVRTLDACGYAAMRAPSSGSATDRDLPDVLASKVKDVWFHRDGTPDAGQVADPLAIELKTTSDTTAYVETEEVTALETFAYRFGATPYLAVRFKRNNERKRVWFVAPEDARLTDAGTYGLPESDIDERASMVALPAGASTEPEVREL